MAILRKSLLFCLSLILGASLATRTLLAEGGLYSVSDVSNGYIKEIESFNSYYEANTYFNIHKDEYKNLVLYKEDTVIKMEYGVVEFSTNESCSLNVGYRSLIRNTTTSINSCYGADGAYLYTNDEGDGVYFKIAGDIGYTDLEDVILHPYELLNSRVSSYSNNDGVLIHNINSQLDSDYYAYSLTIDKAPGFLKRGNNYYSYDGHYFYSDFYTMIDDYIKESHDNAINSDNKYYNYYLYLPFRSLTNYDYSEVEDYFYDDLKITDKIYCYEDLNLDGANDVVNRSQYYDELVSFIEYQNIYGSNALLSLSVSINESSYGKSLNAFLKNNLFNTTEYRESERINNRYDKLSDSVLGFDKYLISKKYANYRASDYTGMFLGDKVSGLNVKHSNDPYWGEKAASNYYLFDQNNGEKDYDSYCLGIIENGNEIIFYSDVELTNEKFVVSEVNEYSLIILEDTGLSYKVQIDPSFNKDYEYDFDYCVAYVSKEGFSKLLNEDKIHQNQMVTITFDGNGGNFDDNSVRTIKVLYGTTPVVNEPIYEGYTFNKFNDKLTKATKDETYVASYKEVNKIIVLNKINDIKQGDLIDLSGSKIKIIYKNGTVKTININTNMIESVDTSNIDLKEITINYKENYLNAEVNILEEPKKIDDEITELINKNIETYLNDGTYNANDLIIIKRNQASAKHKYAIDEVRILDEMMLKEFNGRAHYRIDENNFEMSVSGMTLCLTDTDITNWFSLFRDTYYIRVQDVSSSSRKTLSNIGRAYGFEAVDYFKLDYAFNMKEVESEGPIIYSLKLDDKKADYIYTVYRLDQNDDIVKCRTLVTDNNISFITSKDGDFVILAKKSANTYSGLDYDENITRETSDPDNLSLFLMGIVLIASLLLGSATIVVYYILEYKRKRLWSDYKKLLQKAEFVQEEKQKN